MDHVLFNSSVKTKIGLETDPKWKESQITKKFSFCALIGILPMAQNRSIPGITADRRKNCMPIQAAAARSPSSPPLLLLSTPPPRSLQLHLPLSH
jgi:hypothetical protein